MFPVAPDPETGGRQIEQRAFEVVSTESIGRAGAKAALLVRRGVRRVFAIDIERARALEWSDALAAWSVLDLAGHIEDPALDVALPIRDLVHAAKTDDSVARALIAKHNPVIEAVRAQDRAEGNAQGRAEGKVEGRAEGKVEGRAEGKVEGRAEGKVEGRAEGKVEGRAEGKVEGRAEGKVEGRAEGKAQALLDVLALRDLRIDAPARERILGERDPARLRRWLARALTCTTVVELFAEP
jgi:hypothetical protein